MTGRKQFSSYVSVVPLKSGSTGREGGKSNSPSTFVSQSLWVPCGARGVFGGQVIAQALSAGSQTVPPPLGLHSQHCYFLLPALASSPIEYVVENMRDGRSYATRLVKAVQKGRVVFVLIASYTLPPRELPPLKTAGTPFGFTPSLDEGKKARKALATNPASGSASSGADASSQKQDGRFVSYQLRFSLEQLAAEVFTGIPPAHSSESNTNPLPPFSPRFQIPFPDDLLAPEECVEEEERWQKFLEDTKDSSQRREKGIREYIQERHESPVAIAVAKRRADKILPSVRMTWLTGRLAEGEKPDIETIKAMIAYMTDFQFIGTASRSVGLTWSSTPRLGMLASLDHTTHFYPIPDDFDPSAPLLHVMESVTADVGSGRGLVRGMVYTKEGRLIAATLQEGVVRADLKGLDSAEMGKGILEGGGVGDEDGMKRAKAKL